MFFFCLKECLIHLFVQKRYGTSVALAMDGVTGIAGIAAKILAHESVAILVDHQINWLAEAGQRWRSAERATVTGSKPYIGIHHHGTFGAASVPDHVQPIAAVDGHVKGVHDVGTLGVSYIFYHIPIACKAAAGDQNSLCVDMYRVMMFVQSCKAGDMAGIQCKGLRRGVKIEIYTERLCLFLQNHCDLFSTNVVLRRFSALIVG